MEKARTHFSKIKKTLSFLMVLLIVMSTNISPTHAHRAYFMQILIDESQKIYVSNIILDKSLQEKNKTEAGLWDYDGSTSVSNYDSLEGSMSGTDSMPFTFPPKPHKHLKFLASKNNATSKDADRAYTIADTLVPNLNEILMIKNGNKPYETVDDMIAASEEILRHYNSGSTMTVPGGTISFPRGDNDVTATVTVNGKSFEMLVKMKKGYKDEYFELVPGESKAKKSPLKSDLDFSDDINYISIANIIIQGNYTFTIKGHSSANADEYSKPGTLEVKASEFLSSIMYSLRSLLGLRDISELIYGKGITGSSMYYKGIMPKAWMDNTLKFHMLFQSLTWVALSIAIIKLLFQRNLATINPASRVSLIEGVKDLLVAGFMLISIFVMINLGTNVNEKIVSVFATTAPDYSGWNGGSMQFASFAGVLLQLYYLVITIYLNIIYIIRAISTAILIASSPFFIASIAFQGKNKNLFETWVRELLANIFMQSFHAFVLSFLLSIQMASVRGIELAVVSFSLIPMTKFFRTLITGNSGGIGDSLGMAGISMGGAAIGGVAGGIIGKGKGSVSGKYSEGNSSGGDQIKTKDSGDMARNADRERKEHSINTPIEKSTQKTYANMESAYTNSNEDDNYTKLTNVDGAKGTENANINSINTENEATDTGSVKNDSVGVSSKPFKNLGSFDVKDVAKNVGTSVGRAGLGAAQVTAGAAVALALGGEGKIGANLMRSGGENIGGAVKNMGGVAFAGAKGVGKRGVNKVHEVLASKGIIDPGGNILGMEETSKGDVVVHRDKEMLKNQGISNIKKTSDGNIAISYDKRNLSEDNLAHLNTIEESYTNGNIDNLRERGIEYVNKTTSGETVIHYNQHGQEKLGIKDAYSSDNRVVETKSPGQPLETNYIYSPKSVAPRKQSSDYSNPKERFTKPDGGKSHFTNKMNMDEVIN